MGRTLPTSTRLIEEFENEWRPYARALRKEDRELLYDLFAMLRQQSAPIAYQSSPGLFQAFTLTMFVGVLKRVRHLEILLESYPDIQIEVEAVRSPAGAGGEEQARPERTLRLPEGLSP